MIDGSDFMFVIYMYIIYDEMMLVLCVGGWWKIWFKYMYMVKVVMVFKLNIKEYLDLNICFNK